MTALTEWFQGIDLSRIIEWLMFAAAAIIAICVHESCHALSALWLGDDTAKRMGRISLNPLHHIDWFGLLMLAVFHFGWARPVQVDMRNFRHPKRDMAITALAGPVSNFLLSALALFLLGYFYRDLIGSAAGQFVFRLLRYTAILSISLGLFNLIPIPPLDGSKVLFSFLPDRLYARLMVLERYGMILLIVLVVVMNRVFEVSPVAAASGAVYDVFARIAVFADSLRG